MLHRMAPAEAIWPMARIRFIVAVQLLICPRAIHRPGRTAPRRRRPTRSLQPIVHACGPGRLLRLAHADRSASQSLDPSARSTLILMAMTFGLCGLQASSRDDAGTSNGPGECNASALMQLRFASLVVINLREDLPPAVRPCRAHRKTPTANGWGFVIGGGWLTMCRLAS